MGQKFLIVTRKNRTPYETKIAMSTKEKLVNAFNDAIVNIDDELDWKKLVASERSIQGAYRWAALTYDVFILVEDADGLLAKRQYTIAEFALQRKRTVRSAQQGRIKGLEIVDSDSWKQGYGRCVPVRR